MDGSLVWYASYGSNMSAARFGCYVSGGAADEALRVQDGCRDTSPPRSDRPVWLGGQVYFALESRTWTGGLALYDPDAVGQVAARAYLVTAGQLADVAAQEMHRPVGEDVDLSRVPSGAGLTLGRGRYETLVDCGPIEGRRAFTLAPSWSVHDVPWAAPSGAYLRALATGLVEAHGWGTGEVVDYLLARPGVGLGWSADGLADALAGVRDTG